MTVLPLLVTLKMLVTSPCACACTLGLFLVHVHVHRHAYVRAVLDYSAPL